MRVPEDPNILTTEALSRRVGISTDTLRRLAREGKLPAMKIGKDYRFPYDEVVAALIEQTRRPTRTTRPRRAPVEPDFDALPPKRGRRKSDSAA